MNNEIINIGVVGIGEHIRRAHISQMTNIPNVNFLSWFDPGVESGDVDEIFGEKVDFDNIVSDKRINTVFIGSPDQFHADQFLVLAEAGKNIFIEKIDKALFEAKALGKNRAFSHGHSPKKAH